MRNRHSLKPIYACVLLALASPAASANPLDPTVVNGQAGFTTTGNTLTVTNTPGTIINWQGFSIGANETTRFAQQSAASAVLNRVISNNPSSILGALQSNGRVFLINPNGIVFGAGATVDVAGLVASTLNLSDADFLAGRNSFTQVPGATNISNAGNITAQGDGQTGGQIFLIAPNVENTGVITAPNGEILLAAGYSVDLVSTSDPNLRVNITAPAGDATNVGQLIASSGSLGLFGTVVRNSGAVSADSATMQGGKIVFKASQRVEVGGTVSAISTSSPSPSLTREGWGGLGRAGGVGGTIEVLGNQVGIMDGATITANGTQGGGTVLIGGDAHGANPDVSNAQITYVAPTATINADATDTGNGGKVVVWADDTTRFYGNISARGGINGGNGGFVETSGHNYLDFQGRVDTRAPQGLAGTLLLDPADITIDNSTNNLAGGTSPSTGFFTGATGNSTLTWATINTQLGLGSLEIQTNSVPTTGNGDIFINAGTTLTGTNYLTLLANRNITFANGISVVAAGDVNLIAGWNNSGWAVTGGTGNITFGTSSLSNTGNIVLRAGNSITQLAGSSITANILSISSDLNGGLKLPGGVSLSGSNMVNTLEVDTAIAGGGGLTFSNGKALTIGTGLYFNGIVATGNTNPINITTTAGGITVSQNVTSAGPVSLTAAGAITESGAAGLIDTTGLLTTSSVGGTTLNGANTVGSFNATNSTSGNIALTNTAATLIITGINNTSAAGSATVSNTGAITVGGTVTASNSVSMTGVGISNNSTITGNLGVSLNAGVGTLTNVGVGSITNGGGASTGAINLTADKMALTTLAAGPGTVTAGAGAVNISNSTLTNAIDLGSTTDVGNLVLELSSTELATISTTGLLSIGNASNSGAITVSAALTLANNTALVNGAGGIAINGAITATGKDLTLNTTGAATQTAAITAAGLELLGTGSYTLTKANSIATVAGNTGSASLTDSIALSVGTVNTVGLTATGAIALTSSGAISQTAAISTPGSLTTSSAGGTTLNGANTVTSFNATNTTSGAISLTNTALNLALSGISQTGGGAVTLVVNGNLTLNALSTITAGTAQVTLSATGGNFANNSGSATPITTTGLIRIYSTSPVLDTPGGLVGNYRLYDCTYAGGCSAGTVIPAGQVGLYYSIAPAPVVGEITNISDQQLKKLENMVALDIPADKDDNKPALPVCN